jgi:hypothetical protein
MLPNSFSETAITVIPKPDKDITRKKPTNILYEYAYKNSQQNTRKANPAIKDSMPWPSGIYLRKASIGQCIKINILHHVKRLEKKASDHPS